MLIAAFGGIIFNANVLMGKVSVYITDTQTIKNTDVPEIRKDITSLKVEQATMKQLAQDLKDEMKQILEELKKSNQIHYSHKTISQKE